MWGLTLAMWSDPDLLEPVMTSQNIGTKMYGRERSNSETLRFTNFETVLYFVARIRLKFVMDLSSE